MCLVTLPSLLAESSARHPRRARQRASQTGNHDPFWLAQRWEQYTAGRLAAVSDLKRGPMRKVSQRGQILPAFVKAFERLAVYLDQTGISVDEYYTLLCNRFATSKIPISSRALGSDYYNKLVTEQRTRRQSLFAGRDAVDTQTYLAVPGGRPSVAPESLARDVARFATYRATYHWFPWGRFWLFFHPEFSGAFLFAIDEYRSAFSDPLVHLSEAQADDWQALVDDPKQASKVRDCVTSYRRHVGTLWQGRTGLKYDQLVESLSRLGRPHPGRVSTLQH